LSANPTAEISYKDGETTPVIAQEEKDPPLGLNIKGTSPSNKATRETIEMQAIHPNNLMNTKNFNAPA